MSEALSTIRGKNREFWEDQIKRWQESNLTQQLYCQHSSISYHAFQYWRTKLNAELSVNKTDLKQFIPVKITSKKSTGNTSSSNLSLSTEPPRAIQIKLMTGHVVYIPTSISINDIANLINQLGGANAQG